VVPSKLSAVSRGLLKLPLSHSRLPLIADHRRMQIDLSFCSETIPHENGPGLDGFQIKCDFAWVDKMAVTRFFREWLMQKKADQAATSTHALTTLHVASKSETLTRSSSRLSAVKGRELAGHYF
jgi:hypothetical protein